MKIEDLKNWTVDQLKEEIVRLADEREAKQHEILDKNEKINELQAELDKMCDYNDELKKQINPELDPAFCDAVKNVDNYLREIQDNCITINQLGTALDVIIDRYANLRKIHGLS
nr:MAG TPA: FAM76 protein [Caudoviricetes sp.]DAM59110.1 MAG TPA: FAM76 protein [Caudoviricetes sp.]